VVMSHGQIVATGTHGQLCRDNPWYAQMIQLQHVTAGEGAA
jgi:ABC-type multidrug transport system fused ATPase/permease subunit